MCDRHPVAGMELIFKDNVVDWLQVWRERESSACGSGGLYWQRRPQLTGLSHSQMGNTVSPQYT